MSNQTRSIKRKKKDDNLEQRAAEARQKRCDDTTVEINNLLAERKCAMQVFIGGIRSADVVVLPVEIKVVSQ